MGDEMVLLGTMVGSLADKWWEVKTVFIVKFLRRGLRSTMAVAYFLQGKIPRPSGLSENLLVDSFSLGPPAPFYAAAFFLAIGICYHSTIMDRKQGLAYPVQRCCIGHCLWFLQKSGVRSQLKERGSKDEPLHI